MRYKHDMPIRWVVLMLACIMMIGNYYCYDNPSALQSQMKTLMGSKSPSGVLFGTNFNLLYTVYSIPNMVLPFFGGFFVDKLGCSYCLIIFSMFILLGQIVFALGSYYKSWTIMLLGRVIFGLGGENITVAQSALLADWFAGGELAFAFGINLSISRLGSVINDFVSPVLANSESVSFALFFGCGVCLMSNVTAFVLAPINYRADKLVDAVKDSDVGNVDDTLTKRLIENSSSSSSSSKKSASRRSLGERSKSGERLSSMNLSIVGQAEQINVRDALHFGKMFWILSFSCLVVYGCVLPFNNVASGILLERNYFRDPSPGCTLEFSNLCINGPNAPQGSVKNKEINCTLDPNIAPVLPASIDAKCPAGTDCNQVFYNLTDIVEDDVDCSDPFWGDDIVGCVSDYCNAKDDATETSGKIMSIPYFISASLSPILGFVVDKIGKRAIIASLAPFVLVVVHLSLALCSGSPVLPLIGQGVAYSCFAAVLWPSVPFSVEEKSIGTAYGLITALQNSGLAIFPIIISAIYNGSGQSYIPKVEFFFVALGALGVAVGILLNVYDKLHGGKLNAKGGGDEQNESDDED